MVSCEIACAGERSSIGAGVPANRMALLPAERPPALARCSRRECSSAIGWIRSASTGSDSAMPRGRFLRRTGGPRRNSALAAKRHETKQAVTAPLPQRTGWTSGVRSKRKAFPARHARRPFSFGKPGLVGFPPRYAAAPAYSLTAFSASLVSVSSVFFSSSRVFFRRETAPSSPSFSAHATRVL